MGGSGLHLLAYVLDGSGQFLNGGCLLRSALSQSLGSAGHLIAAGVDLIGGGLDLGQRLAHGDLHRTHGL